MTGFLKRLAVFLGVFAVLYAGSMALLVALKEGGVPVIYRTGTYYQPTGGIAWETFQEYDPAIPRDVIIIGSSHAYSGYDPHVFVERGYSAFNLGTSSQTPLNTYFLIRSFLHRDNAPLVIMDLYEATMSIDGLESASELDLNQPNHGAALGMTWALHDLRGLNLLALRLLTDLDSALYSDPRYRGLGFAPKTDSIGTDAPAPGPAEPFDPVQLKYFEKCVRLCRERGIQLVVASHYERGNERGIFHAPLAEFVGRTLKGSNIPYLDFTEAPGIDDRHWFVDDNHLNATGARIFTGQLVDSLEALGYLSRAPKAP